MSHTTKTIIRALTIPGIMILFGLATGSGDESGLTSLIWYMFAVVMFFSILIAGIIQDRAPSLQESSGGKSILKSLGIILLVFAAIYLAIVGLFAML